MRPHCWAMVAVAGIMSYFSPERALGVPQREGERSRRRWRRWMKGGGGVEKKNLSVMLEKGAERREEEGGGGCSQL